MASNAEERLYYAIDSGDHGVISQLLWEGLPVNTVFYGVSNSWSIWSALHLCCEKGRLECARILLEAKACVDIKDKWNMSPLMYAVTAGWTEVVELLLQYGADIDAHDVKGLTPLHMSVKCEDHTCLSLLVARGAQLESRDILGRTPLWQAAAEDGHVVHLKELLALGADMNTVDTKAKFTPLQAALWYAGMDREAYTEALLAAGACLKYQEDADYDVPHRHPSALMTLLQRRWDLGCDITHEEVQLTRRLLAYGCNVDISLTSACDVPWHNPQV